MHKDCLKNNIKIGPTCFSIDTPSSRSSLSVLLAEVTLASTDNELREGGVTAPKHVGAILM